MLDSLMKKFVRFLSIVGGFSSPEDIERAKRRSSTGTDIGGTDRVAPPPPENTGVK